MMMSNHLQTPAIPTSFQPFYIPQVNKNLLNVLKMEAQPKKENPKQLIKIQPMLTNLNSNKC
jgi:hypothetical protein